MCGYCIERSCVLEFVESERFAQSVERHAMFESAYLQESKSFPQIIASLKAESIFSGQIEIAMFRVWEALIFENNDQLFDAVADEYPKESINAFLAALKQVAEPLLQHCHRP